MRKMRISRTAEALLTTELTKVTFIPSTTARASVDSLELTAALASAGSKYMLREVVNFVLFEFLQKIITFAKQIYKNQKKLARPLKSALCASCVQVVCNCQKTKIVNR